MIRKHPFTLALLRPGSAPLAKQFVALLIAVGLRLKPQPAGVGRGGRRQQSEISFHCLRHYLPFRTMSCTSTLA